MADVKERWLETQWAGLFVSLPTYSYIDVRTCYTILGGDNDCHYALHTCLLYTHQEGNQVKSTFILHFSQQYEAVHYYSIRRWITQIFLDVHVDHVNTKFNRNVTVIKCYLYEKINFERLLKLLLLLLFSLRLWLKWEINLPILSDCELSIYILCAYCVIVAKMVQRCAAHPDSVYWLKVYSTQCSWGYSGRVRYFLMMHFANPWPWLDWVEFFPPPSGVFLENILKFQYLDFHFHTPSISPLILLILWAPCRSQSCWDAFPTFSFNKCTLILLLLF